MFHRLRWRLNGWRNTEHPFWAGQLARTGFAGRLQRHGLFGSVPAALGYVKLALRALAAFLLLPGFVAGVVPWLIAWRDQRGSVLWLAGVVLLLVGTAGLVWCVRDFFVSGRGTLAPWDPPRRLVIVGLYRAVRNPMYLSVLAIVGGWSLFFESWMLGGYAVALAIAFHVRVVRFEELWLQRTFGADWDVYAAAVPRWLPRRAWVPPARRE